MASITIRDLDDDRKRRLRVRAAHADRSMEAEARQILLRAALSTAAERETGADLAESIRARFARRGDVVLPNPPREPTREPPDRAPTPQRRRTRR